MKVKARQAVKGVFFAVWTLSLVWSWHAAKELGVWNADVYLNGVSTGILVMLAANRVMRWADEEHARLVARGEELDNQLKRLAWNTYKAINRIRKEDLH